MRIFDFGQEATGVIAIGQIATGVIAIGQFATGVIAIGQVARGVIAAGQLAVGFVATGQLGVGIAYGAGMLGFGTFAGGLIPIPLLGYVPVGDLVHLRFRPRWTSRPISPWKLLYITVVVAIVLFAALLPLWRELFGVDGVFYVPPPRR